MQCAPHCAGKQQEFTHISMRDCFVQQIQKNHKIGNDIAVAVENDSEFKKKTKNDPFEPLKSFKQKKCDPSKVKCPHMTLTEKL